MILSYGVPDQVTPALKIYAKGNTHPLRTSITNDVDYTSYTTADWAEEWATTQGQDGFASIDIKANANRQLFAPASTPIIDDNVPLYTGAENWEQIKNHVGASYPSRDSHDVKMYNEAETLTRTDSYVNNAIPVYNNANNNNPYTDANNDGVEDTWFTVNVTPGDIANDLAPTNYTWVEEYQNSLDDAVNPPSEIIDVEQVFIVNPSDVEVGGQIQMVVNFTPSNATDKTGVWTISPNGTFATIGSVTGIVTGASEGVSTITFTSNDTALGTISDTTTITTIAAVNRPVTAVTVTPGAATLELGASINLSVAFTPFNASNQTGTWSSNNSNATVDSNSGLVTSVSSGTSDITFTSSDGNFTDKSTITITAVNTVPTAISFVGAEPTIPSRIYIDEGIVDPVATLTTTNADINATHVYSIPLPNVYDYLLFSIVNGNQLQANFTPDFDNPIDTVPNNIYYLVVRTTSNTGGVLDQGVSFQIQEVTEPPVDTGATSSNIKRILISN